MAGTGLPTAWKDLIAALTLLSKGSSNNEISPLRCEHDELTVMSDPEAFSETELCQLKEWGFHPGDEGTFYSFRYGSA